MSVASTEKDATPVFINASPRIYVIILGSVAGVGGVLHGVFEMFQEALSQPTYCRNRCIYGGSEFFGNWNCCNLCRHMPCLVE